MSNEPVAWLYRDSWGTLKLSQIMPPPVGAFPVYTHPVDDTALLRQVLDALCGSRLCSVNSMSSRQEAERLIDKAITALRERLGEKT